jgi:hypothetical protein
MRRWGGWLLILVIVGIISTGGLLAQRYLDRSSDELASGLQSVQQEIEGGDWDGAGAGFAALEDRWDGVRRNWALFTDHQELDSLELRLVRLREFIEARDEINARVEAAEAMSLIRHIPERERLTWRNIF